MVPPEEVEEEQPARHGDRYMMLSLPQMGEKEPPEQEQVVVQELR